MDLLVQRMVRLRLLTLIGCNLCPADEVDGDVAQLWMDEDV